MKPRFESSGSKVRPTHRVDTMPLDLDLYICLVLWKGTVCTVTNTSAQGAHACPSCSGSGKRPFGPAMWSTSGVV
jgi:hypothetical protein